MFGWKSQKIETEKPQRIVIARIEAQSVPFGTFAGVMLFLGLVLMIFAFMGETSAIRLAADGAIWTGWNVLWMASALSRKETNYIVYREPMPPAEGH